jgi:alkylation response protein AidB-like acyl-CoA dehydrogenase
MYVKLELARSNCYYGAMSLAEETDDLEIAAASARIAATEAYRFAAQENIQVHGGIGFTWEANPQFHYRRSKLLALSLGSASRWKDRLVSELEKSNVA